MGTCAGETSTSDSVSTQDQKQSHPVQSNTGAPIVPKRYVEFEHPSSICRKTPGAGSDGHLNPARTHTNWFLASSHRSADVVFALLRPGLTPIC